MYAPTISQYCASITDPRGLFRTLGEPVCECNAYGEPLFTAGGNAAVFQIRAGGRSWALKCYTRPGMRRREEICSYFSGREFPLVSPVHYLPQEIYVYDAAGRGAWHDVTVREWAEGCTLDYEIRKGLHYRDRTRLADLANRFDLMAKQLLDMPWSHGDLKPLNIIVEATGKMRLIDYDAVYYPGQNALLPTESGTPQYSHPARKGCAPGKFLDDYPIALISATLHSLAIDPLAASRYGTADAFLLEPSRLLNGHSEAYEYAKDMASRVGDIRLCALLSLLLSDSPHLPELKDILAFPASAHHAAARTHAVPEPFRKNGKWGYSLEGHTVVPPLLESALEFSEGLAAVTLNGYRHFIDVTGRTAINCYGYEAIKSFSKGAAAVKRHGRWVYIDRHGKEIVEYALSPASSSRRCRVAAGPPNETATAQTDTSCPNAAEKNPAHSTATIPPWKGAAKIPSPCKGGDLSEQIPITGL